MQYLVILCDGMGDHPYPGFGNMTPMEAADKVNMNQIALSSRIGIVKTIPDSISPPGSDPANMSVMGYDPLVYYTGRSPIEAASMGVPMTDTDVAMRCNVVTLSTEQNYADRTMIDYSSGEISTEEASELIKAVDNALGTDIMQFHAGVSYRHCLLWKDGSTDFTCTPPHDITGKPIASYLPGGTYGARMLELMEASTKVLENHPVNQARKAAGKNPANSIWLWGQGSKPALPSFQSKYGLRGAVISAVDLIKGLGVLTNMDVIEVDGVTGNKDTNFEGKGKAVIDCFNNGYDFVYAHIEAPDECGHHGDAEGKKYSIEMIDKHILGPALEYAHQGHDLRILIVPDHATPLDIRTHNHEPVPYLIWDSNNPVCGFSFNEATAQAKGDYVAPGCTLMDIFLRD